MSENSMTVIEAAKVIKKKPQFIRIGLQRGILPFGTAQIMPGSKKYTYYISPALFYKYIGEPLPLKYQEKTYKEVEVITNKIMANEFGVVTDSSMATELIARRRANG